MAEGKEKNMAEGKRVTLEFSLPKSHLRKMAKSLERLTTFLSGLESRELSALRYSADLLKEIANEL